MAEISEERGVPVARTRRTRAPGGPGRLPKRTRGKRSSSTPVETEAGQVRAAGRAASLAGVARRLPRPTKLGLTRRALVFFAVLGILALSYANSLRIYLVQQRDIAIAQQQVAERQVRVAELERTLQRWDDPAFVKSHARTRLGWVMPGEVGYRVIGADGTVLTGANEVEALGTVGATDLSPRWWDRLAGSIERADDPSPGRR